MKARYIGTSDDQVRWGAHNDPRNFLTVGTVYEVADEEIHSWHTKYILTKFPDKKFNSVSFEDVTDG